jgi:tetratricopeptide (TPR) repeat protein
MPFRVRTLFFFLLLLVSVPSSLLCQTRNAASSLKTRELLISTEPGAVIWIDGVRFGKTDSSGVLKIKTVAPGGHTIRARADGFKEKTQPLTPLQKGSISIPLLKTSDEAELAFQEAERLTSVDRDKAVDAYRKAIKLKPAFPEAFVSLARVLSDAGEIEEAQKAIASAHKLRPGYAEATAVQGRIYKDNGDEAKAIAAFKKAITEGKGFQPEAYAGLGILYKEKAEGAGGTGDFQGEAESYTEAAKYLKTALKQLSGAPDSIVIYQLLGLIYERQKRIDDAIATYEEFLRIFPDTAEATAVRSFIVQLKKDRGGSQ